MKKTAQWLGILSGLSAFVWLSGCRGHAPGPLAANAPDWVNKGAGAFADQGHGLFYGVGAWNGTNNPVLARKAAEDQCRGELAQELDNYTAVLDKGYMASTAGGAEIKSGNPTAEEQTVSSTLKSFAKFTLVGATITDYWQDPKAGTTWTLCKLDLNSITQSLNQAQMLDSKIRDYVQKNADKAFGELSAEETKH